ncbi:MAG: ribokinase [Elainellaceae cyanobacterium]
MTLLVFGSINMDFVAQVPRLPQAGETLLGHRFSTTPGGKGANQAVAIARLGAPCKMVGRVGADPFGPELVQHLQTAGVDCGPIRVDSAESSGAAVIEVSDSGENHIVVIPGANGQMDDSDVNRLVALLPQASWLLLQLEIPLPVVLAAARAAHRAGVRVMLDPAPVQPLPDELFGYVDVLTPNQTEAEQLTGLSIATVTDASEAAHRLRQRGGSTVVITLGERGAFYLPSEVPSEEQSDAIAVVPAFSVKAVDTVAAGDVFNGALAVALSHQQGLPHSREDWYRAIRYAAAAAAIAVTRTGAQAAIPYAPEVEGFLSQHTGGLTLDRNL